MLERFGPACCCVSEPCEAFTDCCEAAVPAELKLTVPAGWADGRCDACDAIVGTFVLAQAGPDTVRCAGAPAFTWTFRSVDWCSDSLEFFDWNLEICAVLTCAADRCQWAVGITLEDPTPFPGVARTASYSVSKPSTAPPWDCDTTIWTLALTVEALTPVNWCSAVSTTVTLEKN